MGIMEMYGNKLPLLVLLVLLLHRCSLCDRNEPKERSQDTMHQMLSKATTKGTVLFYCSYFFCLVLCFYLPLISVIFLFLPLSFFTFFFFFVSVSRSCVLSLSSPVRDWGRDLPKSESRWATMTDIISPKQITTLRIHSRPPLAPAKLKLCSPCQIESRKINK